MAKRKEFISEYYNDEIEAILHKADTNPIYLYYDESAMLYRIFGSEKYKDMWVSANESGEMTPEIAKLEIGNFIAPAPYSIGVYVTTNENQIVAENSVGNNIEFTFSTKDSNGFELHESVEVVFSFNNAGNIQSSNKVYRYGEQVSFNIDRFLSVGSNIITVTVTGRSSGVSKMVVLKYDVVRMELTTSFNVALPQHRATDIIVPYRLVSSTTNTKSIQFVVDGNIVSRIETNDLTVDSSIVLKNTLEPGKHHLQLRALVINGDETFWSKTLYREFVVTGIVQKQIMIDIDLAPETLINASSSNLVIHAEQYITSNIKWGYFSSNGQSGQVTWSIDDEDLRTTEAQVTDAESNAEPYILSFVPTTIGEKHLKASVKNAELSGNDEYAFSIIENTSGIKEATDGLLLKLSALGRSNEEPEDKRTTWKYGNYAATFPSDFAWSAQQGWYKDALVLSGGKQVAFNIEPLGSAPHTYGATVEIEFEVTDVDDTNEVVASVWGENEEGNELGIKITSDGAYLQNSDGGVVRTKFKQNERIKLAFIINRVSSANMPHLAYIINNGVYERAMDYGIYGNFSVRNNLILGAANGGATIKVYNIRCYNLALDVNQEMYNTFIDSGKIAQKIIMNDVYEGGVVSVDKMRSVIPVFLFDGRDVAYNNIDTLMATTDKSVKVNIDVKFFMPDNPRKNFEIIGARMKLQGASSLGYPRKNFKLYSHKDNAVMRDYDGNEIKKGLYAFNDGDVPVNVWTIKSDFMDSSCTRNASIARLFGDIEPEASIKDGNGNPALKTGPQIVAGNYKSKTGVTFPYSLRTTPNGLACVAFYRNSPEDKYIFLGQYTLLNDKSNEYVYGFHSIYDYPDDPMCMYMKDSEKDALIKEGKIHRLWDNKDTHSYEILDNTSEFSQFGSLEGWDDAVSVEGSKWKHRRWETAFESRYPEIDDDKFTSDEDRLAEADKQGAPLKAFVSWVVSLRREDGSIDADRFAVEAPLHLDLAKLASYYVYLMRFGAVDQVQKNMMWTTYDGQHWFSLRYDNDTTIDKNNVGNLFYDYAFDRSTLNPNSTGEYYYAGHDSLLWNVLEQSQTFMDLVREVDDALYAAGLTYSNVCHYFDDLASNKWCERIYNENQWYKYIKPLVEQGNDYLNFLQGKDESHRHWWLRNRFDLYDAKFFTGEFTNKSIRIIAGGTPRYSRMYFKSAKSTYFGWGINKRAMQVDDSGNYALYVEKGETFELQIAERALAIGDPVYIFGANNLEEVDLHELAPYFSSFINLEDMYDEELGTNLKKLVIGCRIDSDPSLVNTATDIAFSGFNHLSRLEYLDVRGLTKVTAMDFLPSLGSLKTFMAAMTSLASFTCADGVVFDYLQLPISLRSINLNRVNWHELDYIPTTTLRSVTMNNMGSFDNVRAFAQAWCDKLYSVYGDIEWTNYTLNISGVNWDNMTFEELMKFSHFGTLSLKGRVSLNSITLEQINVLYEKFGEYCFNPGNDFYIKVPPSIYILGPDEVLEGEVIKYNVAVYYEEGGTVTCRIASGSRQGVSISDDGMLTTTENGLADSTITLRAYFVTDAGQSYFSDKSIVIKKRKYPSAVSIEGEKNISMVGEYRFDAVTTPSEGLTGDFEATWLFDGPEDMFDFSFEGLSATIGCKSISDFEEYELRCILTRRYNGSVCASITTKINVIDETIAFTSLTQPALVAAMFASNWCESDKYVKKSECAAITEAMLQPGTSYSTSFFYKNVNLRNALSSFDEFKYFTSLTKVPAYLFYYCTNLKDITFPIFISSLGNYAFYGCSSLVSVDLSGMVGIGSNVFENCTSIESVILGQDISTIQNSAFRSCSKLKEIDLSNVSSFGNGSFSGCSGLESIDVSSASSISGSDFYACSSLSSITCSDSNTIYKVVNNCLIRKSNNNLILGCKGSIIPDDIKTIATYAFGGNESIVTIDLHNVTNISTYAFIGCTNLSSIDLSKVTTLGTSVFENCSALESVNISQVQSIPSSAFRRCAMLRNIIFADTVDFGMSCFENCISLETLEVNSVSNMSASAFSGCTSLRSAIFSNVNRFDSQFVKCTSLDTITITGVESVYKSYANAIYNSTYSLLVAGCKGTTEIHDSCTNIGASAFEGAGITSIDLKNVSAIGNRAFRECEHLTSVTMNNVSSIGTYAFYLCKSLLNFNSANASVIPSYCCYQCSSLTSITLGSMVSRIDSNAFNYCENVSVIISPNTTAPVLAQGAFNRTGYANAGKGTNMVYISAQSGTLESYTSSWSVLLGSSNGFTFSNTL